MKRYEYLGRLIEIPEGYEWVAVDSKGAAFAYENEPNAGERVWHAAGRIFGLFGVGPRKCWKDTLRHVDQLERIGEEPQLTEVEQLRARMVVMCGDIESVADDLEHPLPSVARQVAELRKIVADAEEFLQQEPEEAP